MSSWSCSEVCFLGDYKFHQFDDINYQGLILYAEEGGSDIVVGLFHDLAAKADDVFAYQSITFKD